MSRSKIPLPLHERVEASPDTGSARVAKLDSHGQRVIDLDIVSDVVCPWCYVGKRRVERAIAMLSPGVRVNVTWRPYELNPWLPPEGMDRQEYRRAKFGSIERSRALDSRLVAAGEAEGIPFDFERIGRTPNTRNAHRLTWQAQRQGKQDAVVEALFRAYFVEGADVGDPDALVGIAQSSGLNGSDIRQFLSGDEGCTEVQAEEDRYRALGIDGVPSFLAGDQVIFSGAGDPQLLADAIQSSGAAQSK